MTKGNPLQIGNKYQSQLSKIQSDFSIKLNDMASPLRHQHQPLMRTNQIGSQQNFHHRAFDHHLIYRAEKMNMFNKNPKGDRQDKFREFKVKMKQKWRDEIRSQFYDFSN